MNISYREATENDLKEIEVLVKAAIMHMNEQGIRQWDDKYPTKEDFTKDMQKKELYVGIQEEKIAVVYVLNQECDEDYKNGQWKKDDVLFYVLHRLCVNPYFQKQGIAKATIKKMQEQVLLKGAKAIRLDAFSQNPYALKLYKNCGFEIVGSAVWRMGEFYLMEKYL